MTSKKTVKEKRASLPRSADYTKAFLADWQKLQASGRYDMRALKDVMLRIIALTMLHYQKSTWIMLSLDLMPDAVSVTLEATFC